MLTPLGSSIYIDDMVPSDVLSEATDQTDPVVGLAAVSSLRRLVEQLEALQVDHARTLGWSWQQIAAALGVSKQAVHKKHSRRTFTRQER
jgi:hypothetical protein